MAVLSIGWPLGGFTAVYGVMQTLRALRDRFQSQGKGVGRPFLHLRGRAAV